jgi:hypothetical protein
MHYENVLMGDPIFDVICNKIEESYKNACILYIDKVVNDNLLERYEKYKKEHPFCNEYNVFHGTRKENIKSISLEGFDIKYNTVSAFGKGTYFADNAGYSKAYMNKGESFSRNIKKDNDMCFMFYCKIWHTGQASPGIHVVKDNDATYPEYIVAFSKNE